MMLSVFSRICSPSVVYLCAGVNAGAWWHLINSWLLNQKNTQIFFRGDVKWNRLKKKRWIWNRRLTCWGGLFPACECWEKKESQNRVKYVKHLKCLSYTLLDTSLARCLKSRGLHACNFFAILLCFYSHCSVTVSHCKYSLSVTCGVEVAPRTHTTPSGSDSIDFRSNTFLTWRAFHCAVHWDPV